MSLRVHGLSKHPLYGTWTGMIDRCEKPRNHAFHRYGGRGIQVCERWHDVRLFIEDIERLLGPRPQGKTLDRIDNDGGYEPGNVRWATPLEQAQPRSSRARAKVVQTADYVGQLIEAGELARGQKLPAERDLAIQWGIRYGTARRAVRELRERGLVVSRVGKGTFVAS
jgi:hypothetical protein